MERKADILVYEVLILRRPSTCLLRLIGNFARSSRCGATLRSSDHEVFDAGLIGEGVLHALAAARLKLALPDAVLVPASAMVTARLYAIQMKGCCVAVQLASFLFHDCTSRRAAGVGCSCKTRNCMPAGVRATVAAAPSREGTRL